MPSQPDPETLEQLEPYSVLVVDDEEGVVDTISKLLLRQGYTVRTAGSGREALSSAEANSPDLIMCDNQMPEMNGIEVFQALGKVCPDAVRILITGQSDLGIAVSAINDAGVYRFIRKPWHSRDMVLMVRRALEHYRLVQEGKVLIEMLELALRQKQVQVRGLEHQVDRYKRMLEGNS
jgi:adenylate cyclase